MAGLALIVGVSVVAAAVAFFAASRRAAAPKLSRETRRRDRTHDDPALHPTESREIEISAQARARADESRTRRGGTPATDRHVTISAWEPVDETELGVTRRQFINRGVISMMAIALGGFGASMLAFLWPGSSGGFGGKIPAGKLSTILAFIDANRQPFYVPEARTYIQPYPAAALPAAKKIYPDYIYANMQQGIVALYQRCTHLGCRVPWCQTSQWFECPCHGSKYNRVGEKRDGPTPRGLDRFQAIIAPGGSVTVNTGLLALGPPIGTNTTGQVADGPHCVG